MLRHWDVKNGSGIVEYWRAVAVADDGRSLYTLTKMAGGAARPFAVDVAKGRLRGGVTVVGASSGAGSRDGCGQTTELARPHAMAGSPDGSKLWLADMDVQPSTAACLNRPGETGATSCASTTGSIDRALDEEETTAFLGIETINGISEARSKIKSEVYHDYALV